VATCLAFVQPSAMSLITGFDCSLDCLHVTAPQATRNLVETATRGRQVSVGLRGGTSPRFFQRIRETFPKPVDRTSAETPESLFDHLKICLTRLMHISARECHLLLCRTCKFERASAVSVGEVLFRHAHYHVLTRCKTM